MLDNTQISLIKERLYKYSGIFLNDSKLTMIKNRIYHLMHETHINSIDSLLSSIETNPKIQQQFINSFTTNKTDFFREYFHFQDMIDFLYFLNSINLSKFTAVQALPGKNLTLLL